jgi:hypothetical protein
MNHFSFSSCTSFLTSTMAPAGGSTTDASTVAVATERVTAIVSLEEILPQICSTRYIFTKRGW